MKIRRYLEAILACAVMGLAEGRAKVVKYGVQQYTTHDVMNELMVCRCQDGERSLPLSKKFGKLLVNSDTSVETCADTQALEVCEMLLRCRNCTLRYEECFQPADANAPHCSKEIYNLEEVFFKPHIEIDTVYSNKTLNNISDSSPMLRNLRTKHKHGKSMSAKKSKNSKNYRSANKSNHSKTGRKIKTSKNSKKKLFSKLQMRAGRKFYYPSGILPLYPTMTKEGGACKFPHSLTTSDIHCSMDKRGTICTQTCIFGYTLPGGVREVHRCDRNTNTWHPATFQECRPFVDCSLTLTSGGTLDCYTASTQSAPLCYVSCARHEHMLATGRKAYECRVDGSWSRPLPFCVRPGSSLALVPAPPLAQRLLPFD